MKQSRGARKEVGALVGAASQKVAMLVVILGFAIVVVAANEGPAAPAATSEVKQQRIGGVGVRTARGAEPKDAQKGKKAEEGKQQVVAEESNIANAKVQVSPVDMAASAGHHHGKSHGKYYMYTEVPKKHSYKMGFKRGNHKHEIERKESVHKEHVHSYFKWHDKKGKGSHKFIFKHHDKKKHHGHH